MGIKKKLIISFGLILFIFFITLGITNYVLMRQTITRMTESNLTNVMENAYNIADTLVYSSIKNYLRAVNEKGKNVVKYYYNLYQNGKISETDAYDQVKSMFLSPYYGKIGMTGYIAAVSDEGLIKIHPLSEGVNALEKDFMKKAVEMKNGYIEYMWKNKGEEKEKAKAGWISYFEPWNLLIWASSYKSEFSHLIDISVFKQNIMSVKIGDTGYPFIVDSKGNVIIHPYYPEGDNIYNLKDENNKYFIKNIIKTKNGKMKYLWESKNNINKKSKWKIAYFKHLKDLDWYVVSTIDEDEIYEPIYTQIHITIIVFIIGLLISIPIMLFIVYNFVKPISSLIKVITKVDGGNLDIKTNINTNDEIGKLAKSFDNMTLKLKRYNENLQEMVNERTAKLNEVNKKLRNKNFMLLSEFKMAKRIQLSMIPNEHNFPKIKELNFGGEYLAKQSVGGDLYDIIRVGKNKYSFLMADVSGHGIPAALITTMIKVSFKNHASYMKTTAEICSKVNDDICNIIGDLKDFVSVYYCSLNLETGILEFTNGGHPPALLYKADTKTIEALDTDGSLFGVMTSDIVNFGSEQIELSEGDKILLFTDGIIEAQNDKNEFYRIHKLKDFIGKNSHLPPRQFVDELIKDVELFCGGLPPTDDRAVFYIEFISKIRKGQDVKDSIRLEARNIKMPEESVKKENE